MTLWTDEALDRVLAAHDPAPSDHISDSAAWPESEALLAQILAEDRRSDRLGRLDRRRRRPVWISVAAAAAIVVAGVVTIATRETSHTPPRSAPVTVGGTSPTMSLVAFSTESDGSIVAQITDPDAAASQLDAVFAAHHLNITVEALPVSPSLVGTIVYDDGTDFQPIHAGACLGGGDQCTVGFVIPADWTGSADIVVGRAAEPGQIYQSADSSFAAGEALHCAGVFNQQVSTAAPIVATKGLTVEWRVGNNTANLTSAPADDYVVNGVPISSTTVMLSVQPTPLPASTPDLVQANTGC